MAATNITKEIMAALQTRFTNFGNKIMPEGTRCEVLPQIDFRMGTMEFKIYVVDVDHEAAINKSLASLARAAKNGTLNVHEEKTVLRSKVSAAVKHILGELMAYGVKAITVEQIQAALNGESDPSFDRKLVKLVDDDEFVALAM